MSGEKTKEIHGHGGETAANTEALHEQAIALAVRYLEAHARLLLSAERYESSVQHYEQALTRARETLQATDALRHSISAHASSLRALGVPCERAITLVRDLADDAIAAATAAVSLNAADRRALVEELVLWTIDAYIAP